MTGVETEADVRDLEDPLDLPGRLDVGPRLMMERGLVASVAAPSNRLRQTNAESLPALRVKAQPVVGAGPPGARPAGLAAGIGKRRPGRRPESKRGDCVE